MDISLIHTYLNRLYIPPPDSHKGMNGRLLLIGGSTLFHAASLWSLTVASRIVDLVHYASVPENNALVSQAKTEFKNGIVISRSDIADYIDEDDAILIGPGMVRVNTKDSKLNTQYPNLQDVSLPTIDKISDEGLQTEYLTNYVLTKYPQKQWVLDAGAIQMLDVSLIPPHAILTPHGGEFEGLWEKWPQKNESLSHIREKVQAFAQAYTCILLLKGKEDIICDGRDGSIITISGGNAGMTKGGTGDVLSGMIAALSTKSDPMVAAVVGSYVNKQAGERLYERVGPYYNASDVADVIPEVLHEVVQSR